MLLAPSSSWPVGRPDFDMIGSTTVRQHAEAKLTADASGEVFAIYTPGNNRLATYVGATAPTLQGLPAPAPLLEDHYSIMRVVAGELSMMSDIIMAGSSDVSGSVIAGCTAQALGPSASTPDSLRFNTFNGELTYAEADVLTGARAVLAPLGHQPPHAVPTAGQLTSTFCKVTHFYGLQSALETQGFAPSGGNYGPAATILDLLQEPAATPAAGDVVGIPEYYSGAVSIQGNMWMSLPAALKIIVSRVDATGATVTREWIFENGTTNRISVFDNEPGMLVSIELNANAGGFQFSTISGEESSLAVEFLESQPEASQPALFVKGHGLQSGQVVRVRLNTVVEVVPDAGFKEALPTSVALAPIADPDDLVEIKRNLMSLRWAHVGAQSHADSAATASSLFGKIRRGITRVAKQYVLPEAARYLRDAATRKLEGGF